jgi:isopenicillin N synthase-like dioxygenase
VTERLPIIDMAALSDPGDDAGRARVAGEIARACRAHGFFYLVGHGIGPEVLDALETESRRFFALPLEARLAISMARGGRAWRGYFPVGGELTSGRPDLKEGLYLGTELGPDHPRVRAGVPMHGANLWPAQLPGLRAAATAYMDGATRAAAGLVEGVSLSLGLDAQYFARAYTPGVSANTPTTGSSRCLPRTATAACRSRRPAAGSKRRRSKARWSATSATCWSG